jgi:hypothetical protein
MPDVIRPNSVLTHRPIFVIREIEGVQCLVSDHAPAESGLVNRGLDGGSIPSSIACISPGKSHFSWSWGESNPLASTFPHPGHSVAPQVTFDFRVTVVDRK